LRVDMDVSFSDPLYEVSPRLFLSLYPCLTSYACLMSPGMRKPQDRGMQDQDG